MPIRMMTYNILNGGKGREAQLLRVLQVGEPDLVILQELNSPRLLELFASQLGMASFFAAGTSARNLGLLSRYPIKTCWSYHPFPPIRTTILEATIEYAPQQRLGVVGVHLVPHFAWPLELWRCWELHYALRRLTSYTGLPCVLAGDFNAIAPADKVEQSSLPRGLKWMLRLQGGIILRMVIRQVLRANLIDCYRTCNPQHNGFTVPAGNPNARLDYIFANLQMANRLTNCTVLQMPDVAHVASDHYPVMATFGL